jgi:hypothetical protein
MTLLNNLQRENKKNEFFKCVGIFCFVFSFFMIVFNIL